MKKAFLLSTLASLIISNTAMASKREEVAQFRLDTYSQEELSKEVHGMPYGDFLQGIVVREQYGSIEGTQIIYTGGEMTITQICEGLEIGNWCVNFEATAAGISEEAVLQVAQTYLYSGSNDTTRPSNPINVTPSPIGDIENPIQPVQPIQPIDDVEAPLIPIGRVEAPLEPIEAPIESAPILIPEHIDGHRVDEVRKSSVDEKILVVNDLFKRAGLNAEIVSTLESGKKGGVKHTVYFKSPVSGEMQSAELTKGTIVEIRKIAKKDVKGESGKARRTERRAYRNSSKSSSSKNNASRRASVKSKMKSKGYNGSRAKKAASKRSK